MNNTEQYIIDKYKINVGNQYIVEIPNMGRDNLAELFAELNFTKGAELGVDRGGYSEVLLKANPKCNLLSIDPWGSTAYEPNTYVNEKQEYFEKNFVETVHRLDKYPNSTILRQTSKDALTMIEDNFLDFVYIDANHDFPNFTFDLHNWIKKIRPGGIISGHDYAYFSYSKFNHVKRALDAYARCYRMIPLFIIGAYEQKEGTIRDKYRSWMWIKK